MPDSLLLSAFLRAASLSARAKGSTTDRAILEAILQSKFEVDATNGRTVVSVTEQGGTTTFAIPQTLGPAEVMQLAEEGLQMLDRQADPNTVSLRRVRRARRLRASFLLARP